MKKARKHLLFIVAALACVHLPLLAMYLVKSGPAAYVLFYFPPWTLVPATALVLGACAGANLKKFWYVPVLVPAAYLLSLYGMFHPALWMGAYLLAGAVGMLLCHFIRKFMGLRPGESAYGKNME